MARLEVKDIFKSFGKTEVLKGISFEMEGGVLAIIGSSGSGKTTLLRCLNFLETPTSGQIIVNGEKLFDSSVKEKFSDKQIRKKRLHFGLVVQQFNLFPQYNVIDNITLSPRLRAKTAKYYGRSKSEVLGEINLNAVKLLERVGLSDKATFYPCQLSGGQQQRVSIARALVKNPSVILADEPTANLDSVNAVKIIELMQEMNVSHNTTFIFSTHDRMVMNHCRRLIHIKDGRLTD